MASGAGGDQSPAPRSVSNRRHGPPAPTEPSMIARRWRAAWLRFRARRSTVNPRQRVSQPPAGLDTARRHPRLGPVRPASARRPASEPPSTPTAYAESAAQRAPVARSVRLSRSGGAQPLSAAHQRSVRCDSALNPAWAVHVAASPDRRHPLRLPVSRLRRHSQGPPAWPPATPAQFPAPPAGVRITAFAPVWLSVTCERRKGWNSKVGPRDPWRVPYRMTE